jgi:hypothetical protein
VANGAIGENRQAGGKAIPVLGVVFNNGYLHVDGVLYLGMGMITAKNIGHNRFMLFLPFWRGAGLPFFCINRFVAFFSTILVGY